MQYFPGIDPTHDFYANQGVYQKVCNVNDTYDFIPYYNSPLLPSPTSHAHLDIDVIKQKIFEHEAIFRNQIMELHRLYDRQRELMNEVRNDFSKENIQVRSATSEYGLIEQKQSSVTWLCPSLVSLSATHTNLVQLEVEKNVQTDKGMCKVECASRKCELLSVKCKKYNNKMLDLELLATEYMDDKDDKLSVVAEATHPIIYTSQISASNDEHIDLQPLGPSFQEKGLHAESISACRFLFDLNQPLDEEATPSLCQEDLLLKDLSSNKPHLVGCFDYTNRSICESVADVKEDHHSETIVKLSYTHAGQKTSDSNPNSTVISADSPSLKPKHCSEHSAIDPKLKRPSKERTLNSRKAQWCLLFSENNTRDTLIRIPKSLQHPKHNVPMHSMFDFRRNPNAVLALPCTSSPSLTKKKNYKPFMTTTVTDRDNYQLSELQRNKLPAQRGLLNPVVDHVAKSRKCKKGRRNVRARNVFQDSYRLEPLSPENEECSPPRGESNEILLEMHPYFYTAKDGTTQADLADLAAKAILFLSTADFHMDRCSLFGPDNPLHWFAEVVSDVESALECQEGSMFHDLDDFETMTLKLEDTNKEDQFCRSIFSSQDEKSALVSTVYNRATRARGKRSRKLKDFQGVVLLGISSLSRHEVTEDLQLIECLMETTKTPKGFGSKKRYPRERKQSYIAPIPAEYSPRLLDLQNENCEHHTSKRRPLLFDWGRISKRRRGQRNPARKLTFCHLAPTLKAH